MENNLSNSDSSSNDKDDINEVRCKRHHSNDEDKLVSKKGKVSTDEEDLKIDGRSELDKDESEKTQLDLKRKPNAEFGNVTEDTEFGQLEDSFTTRSPEEDAWSTGDGWERYNYDNNLASLREFDILDESNESLDGDLDDSSASYTSDESFCSDIPEEEIETMLEEGLPDRLKNEERRAKTNFSDTKIKEKLFKLAKEHGLYKTCPSCSNGKNNCNCPKDINEDTKKAECTESEYVNIEPKELVQLSACSNQTPTPPVSEDTGMTEPVAVNEDNPSEKDKTVADGEQSRVFKITDEQGNELEYETKQKVVLEEIEQNHFDLLPEGWMKLGHKSGMPVYLHKKSRVCCFSRPYYLGPGSTRNHAVPLSAIPCLQYRRALENEKKNAESMEAQPPPAADSNGPCPILHCARIETAAENQAAQSLDHKQIQDYCSSLFMFKTVNSIRYKCWVARRKLAKTKKKEEQRQRPTLPGGTKLLKFPIRNPDGTQSSHPHREWIMNPAGKSYVCILHEYVQHALKSQPSYKFKELQNPSTPYSATISIDGTPYGSAFGTSKKIAKSMAAKAALEILIPDMKQKIEPEGKNNADNSGHSIFDEIRVEDPRVAEFCAKTTEPSPYAILLTCLQRNYALADVDIQYSVNKQENKKNEFTMKVGKHEATIICKNKRDGKQRASQAILQALHPHVTTWGSLLRLYGNGSVKNVKEKKQEEQEITLLQSKASLNQPNFAILNKLKSEMSKLYEKKAAMKPIGKFIPPENVILPSPSSTDLDKVNLHHSD